jgi:lambda family phage portal protein
VSLLSRLAARFGYARLSVAAKSSRRAYAAAKLTNVTSDWIMSPVTADADLRAGMVPVRVRARDLAQNNDYAKAYLRALKKNVVGADGFTLQVKAVDYAYDPKTGKTAPKPDALANAIMEQGFADWCRPGICDMSGRFSFRKVQELSIETAGRDGEMFLRIVRGQAARNKYGFALQLIEPDYVDETHNVTLQNGNVIRLGVEIDLWRRPIAYWIKKFTPGMDIYGAPLVATERERIPAADMIHFYDPERADQTRGISWLVQSMIRMRHLGGYEEAAVVNARAGASKMGFYKPGLGGEEYTGDSTSDQGNPVSSVEPGVNEILPPGWEFIPYEPKYPDQQYDGFVRATLRGMSAGLGVAFSSLSNDLSDVNFSSIRAGLIEERETWKALQKLFVEMVNDRVFSEWLLMSLTTGAINLPLSRFDKFNVPKWTGRRWAWVDPLKDVEANRAAVAAGFKSATQVINEMGGDREDVYQEIAQDLEYAESLGLSFDFSTGGKANVQGNPEEDGTAAGGEAVPVGGGGNGKDATGGANGRDRLLL